MKHNSKSIKTILEYVALTIMLGSAIFAVLSVIYLAFTCLLARDIAFIIVGMGVMFLSILIMVYTNKWIRLHREYLKILLNWRNKDE